MTRTQLTEKIRDAKRLKDLSWKQIVAEIGGGTAVYVTAALMGQMRLRPEQAQRAAQLFDLGEEETLLLQEVPYRGSLPTAVPTDPLIYRFYEVVQVYGTTWKELIQEEFGDGIMSAIDFDMAIERQPDQKGDRVKINDVGQVPFVQGILMLNHGGISRFCRCSGLNKCGTGYYRLWRLARVAPAAKPKTIGRPAPRVRRSRDRAGKQR